MRRQISIVVLSCLVLGLLFSLRAAHAQTCDDDGDIPFNVTYVDPSLPDDACIYCAGPKLRSSNSTPLKLIRDSIASKGSCTFYAANISTAGFHPWGSWSCIYSLDCSISSNGVNGFELQSTVPSITIAVTGPEANTFNRADFTFNGCKDFCYLGTQSVQSSLSRSADQRDQDDFAFKGTPGDTVVVRVEPDNKSGHNGGKLSLASGVNPDVKTKGTLPLSVTDTIPAGGTYTVIVKQVQDATKRFEGTYHVSVQSQSGQVIERIKPLASVE